MAGMYLAYMGKQGIRAVAELCYQRAHYAAKEIDGLEKYKVLGNRPFFNEFGVRCPLPVAELNEKLLEAGILGGYDLADDYPDRENQMLVCVTEMNDRKQIDHLVETLAEIG